MGNLGIEISGGSDTRGDRLRQGDECAQSDWQDGRHREPTCQLTDEEFDFLQRVLYGEQPPKR
jgi:hypothetical protein